MKTVLFVCTGNTCRSPMAEGYLKHKNLENINVLSAGIFADGSPVSENANQVCKEHNIDISKHISAPLTKQMLDNADYVLCMSKTHKEMIDNLLQEKSKVLVLGGGIPDPYGYDIKTYNECFLKIKSAIDDFCERYL